MLKLININKYYGNKKKAIHALKDISLTVEAGEIFGIIGASGAGKSTLVRCMNLLEKPSSGDVLFEGTNLTQLDNKQLRQMRSNIGMIFQHFHLMEQKTVLANVCFPLEIQGLDAQVIRQKATEMLKIVGLEEKLNVYPSQLSGGQKQRVAIARALVNEPKVLLCDEATSALDPSTRNAILDLLKSINVNLGITIIIITHEMGIVEALCDRVAVLEAGTVAEIGTTHQVLSQPKAEVTKKLMEERHIKLSTQTKQGGA